MRAASAARRWPPRQSGYARGWADQAISNNLSESFSEAVPAVTIAIAKKKGTNAVTVAQTILDQAEKLRAEMLPDDVEMVITRNYGLTANEKVNDLVDAVAWRS